MSTVPQKSAQSDPLRVISVLGGSRVVVRRRSPGPWLVVALAAWIALYTGLSAFSRWFA